MFNISAIDVHDRTLEVKEEMEEQVSNLIQRHADAITERILEQADRGSTFLNYVFNDESVPVGEETANLEPEARRFLLSELITGLRERGFWAGVVDVHLSKGQETTKVLQVRWHDPRK